VAAPTGPANEAHDLVMSVFGEMSKGERNRVEIQLLPHLDNWLSRKFDPIALNSTVRELEEAA